MVKFYNMEFYNCFFNNFVWNSICLEPNEADCDEAVTESRECNTEPCDCSNLENVAGDVLCCHILNQSPEFCTHSISDVSDYYQENCALACCRVNASKSYFWSM